jgi:small conductance mechanosensitive channel
MENLESIWDVVVLYIPDVLLVIGLIIGLWLLAGWVRRLVISSLNRTRFDVTLTKFFGNMTRYAILVMGFLAILSYFGIQTTSFAAVIGAAGLAIGLAFQGTLSNFAAGMMLLAFRPFKVGDVVSVAGVTGKVDEIELFVTKFDTPDNRRIIVPNSSIFGSTIENVTFHSRRRCDVEVGTDYGADLAEVRRVLEAAAAGVEGRLEDPPPQVVLVNLGDSSINWQVRVWCNTPDFFAVKERTTHDVKNALDAAEIGIPFPQMDVHVDGLNP